MYYTSLEKNAKQMKIVMRSGQLIQVTDQCYVRICHPFKQYCEQYQ